MKTTIVFLLLAVIAQAAKRELDEESLVAVDLYESRRANATGNSSGAALHGPGGRNSPFERLRNPNAEEDEDDDVGSPAEPAAAAEAEEFTYEDVMDETEAACYAARYTDLNGTDPNEHYARVGAE